MHVASSLAGRRRPCTRPVGGSDFRLASRASDRLRPSKKKKKLKKPHCRPDSAHSLWRNVDVLMKLSDFLSRLSSSGHVPDLPDQCGCFWGPGCRGQTTDVPSLQETFRLSPELKKKRKKEKERKRESTVGFYHKCFITSLRGGLARSPSFCHARACARARCGLEGRLLFSGSPVLRALFLFSFFFSLCLYLFLAALPAPLITSLCLIYVSLTTI